MAQPTCAVLARLTPLTPKVYKGLLALSGETQASLARLLGKAATTTNAWSVGRHPVPAEITLLLLLMASTPDWRERVRTLDSALATEKGEADDQATARL